MTASSLKALRFFKGISQDELAKQAGVDQATISRLERGVLLANPSTEKLKERICEVLGVRPKDVFPGERP